MKALILKDLFVLLRQMKVFLLMIVIFSILPGDNMTTFAIVYAAMMPYTALAYDERSHWDQLAAMMPYTGGDVVLAKYLLGYLFVALSAGLGFAAKLIMGADPVGAPLGLCIGLIMMALTLPLMFRFGVEKGRMFFIIVMVAVAVGGTSLVMGIAAAPNAGDVTRVLYWALPIAAIALNAVSIPLAIRAYEKREA